MSLRARPRTFHETPSTRFRRIKATAHDDPSSPRRVISDRLGRGLRRPRWTKRARPPPRRRGGQQVPVTRSGEATSTGPGFGARVGGAENPRGHATDLAGTACRRIPSRASRVCPRRRAANVQTAPLSAIRRDGPGPIFFFGFAGSRERHRFDYSDTSHELVACNRRRRSRCSVVTGSSAVSTRDRIGNRLSNALSRAPKQRIMTEWFWNRMKPENNAVIGDGIVVRTCNQTPNCAASTGLKPTDSARCPVVSERKSYTCRVFFYRITSIRVCVRARVTTITLNWRRQAVAEAKNAEWWLTNSVHGCCGFLYARNLLGQKVSAESGKISQHGPSDHPTSAHRRVLRPCWNWIPQRVDRDWETAKVDTFWTVIVFRGETRR